MASTKSQVRTEILAARRSLTQQVRKLETAALTRHLISLLTPGTTVCAYVPVGSEPGSVALIDAAQDLGVDVLLPVAREDAAGTPLALQWGRYIRGGLIEAPFGLREPGQPWLPADAIADAAVVLVPALAVDRHGARVGRGAGFYDRSLPLTRPGTLLVAVIRDAELVDHLPAEPHDVPMTHALTPNRGLVALGGRECARPTGGSST